MSIDNVNSERPSLLVMLCVILWPITVHCDKHPTAAATAAISLFNLLLDREREWESKGGRERRSKTRAKWSTLRRPEHCFVAIKEQCDGSLVPDGLVAASEAAGRQLQSIWSVGYSRIRFVLVKIIALRWKSHCDLCRCFIYLAVVVGNRRYVTHNDDRRHINAASPLSDINNTSRRVLVMYATV